MDDHVISYDKYVIDLCGYCKKDSNLKCSGCNISSYCSRKCQKKDWRNHQMIMGCSKNLHKDPPQENVEVNKAKSSDDLQSVLSNNELKITHGELMHAMIVLKYAFTNSGKTKVHRKI